MALLPLNFFQTLFNYKLGNKYINVFYIPYYDDMLHQLIINKEEKIVNRQTTQDILWSANKL